MNQATGFLILPLIATLTLLFQAPASASGSSSPLTLSIDQQQGRLEITQRGQKLLVYAFADQQFKPYVKELYTLAGDNVLLDAPADHLHHHGIMYAIRVNGTNFWEEAVDPGHQRTLKLWSNGTANNPAGLPQASFSHLIHWVAGKNKALAENKANVLLIERRTLTVTVDESAGEVALQWRSAMEVGQAAPKVILTGSDYHGLGVRFPRTFDKAARHVNSEDAPYPTQGKHDLLAAKWSAISLAANGREMMLALFARPAETRGPTVFFSMLDPFAYLSATQGLDKQPLEYSAGDKWTLDYLVTAYAYSKSAKLLQDRYAVWMKERR